MKDEVIVWGGKEYRKSEWPKTFEVIKEYDDRRKKEEKMKSGGKRFAVRMESKTDS